MIESSSTHNAHARAEQVARASYGRLLSILASRTGDIVAAEEHLASAFARALEVWPDKGVPEKPEAWLLTTARNAQTDQLRSAAHKTGVALDAASELADMKIPNTISADDFDAMPDERLKLMFVCAHPAIDEEVHTPLMLQTVLGLDVKDIGPAFLMPTATLAQRLVRAKRKIKNAGIPFTVPQQDELQGRCRSVLEAIYGAYSIDWQWSQQEDIANDLSVEAMFLASVVAKLLPDNAEALGLFALIAFSMARRPARVDGIGKLVPIDQQDVDLWDTRLIERAETHLQMAARREQMGRFQLEAAIQSIHCHRLNGDEPNWLAIAQLYEGLVQLHPTAGSIVGRASAVARVQGAQAGLRALEVTKDAELDQFQPYWATKAHFFKELGEVNLALDAFEKALELTSDEPSRQYLRACADSISD